MPPFWPFALHTTTPHGPPYTCTHEHADGLIARVEPLPDTPAHRPPQATRASATGIATDDRRPRDKNRVAKSPVAEEYDPYREDAYVGARERAAVAVVGGPAAEVVVREGEGGGRDVGGKPGVERGLGERCKGGGDVEGVFEEVCLDDEISSGDEAGDGEGEWVFVEREGGRGGFRGVGGRMGGVGGKGRWSEIMGGDGVLVSRAG
ncbi:hypothetical protein MMC18_004351 [Xylographa bjoerkii]|nr:hypothetical protein [Xylographa bjoerkii]